MLLYRNPVGQAERTMADAVGRVGYEVLWDLECLRRPGSAGNIPAPTFTTSQPGEEPTTRHLSWEDGRQLDREVAAFAADYAGEGAAGTTGAAEEGEEDPEVTDQGGQGKRHRQTRPPNTAG